MRALSRFAGCLAVLSVMGTARAQESRPAIVRAVEFDSPAAIDRADYRREMPLRIGEPLSPAILEDSVRWLERKKIFASVRTETTRTGDDATVIFHLEPLPFVIEVALDGGHAIDEDTLLRRARIREDEAASSERIEAGKRRIVDLYAERGYPHAAVDATIESAGPGQVKVILRISEGPPVRFGAIALDGIDGDLATAARSTIAAKEGAVAEKGAVAAGRKSLLALLRRRGFYEADVDANESTAGDVVSVHYAVRLGPRFDFVVNGNEHIPTATLLDLDELADRPIVTRGTWQIIAVRMQERYAEQGYAFATVAATVGDADPRTVRFEVREGPQVRVRRVRFRGNQAIDQDALEKRLDVRPKRFLDRFGPDPSLFRADVLADDLEAIRTRYRELGYLDTKVEEGEREFTDDKTSVVLTIDILEGRRTLIAGVAVDGLPAGVEASPTDLAARPGKPYRDEDLESDRRLLRKRLGEHGFADARVTASHGDPVAMPGADEQSVDVHYHVEPGSPVHVGRVIVQNNYFTRDSTVRQSAPFSFGDPLDPEKLSSGQIDIYRLGLFRSVAVRPLDDSGPVRDVGIEVVERPGGEMLAGFGYDTRAGLRNFLQLAHNNIAGTGDRLSLRGDLNLAPNDLTPDEYIVSLDGKQPHFLGSRTALRANATYQQSERQIDEFSIRRTSFSIGPERELRKGLRASFFVEFEDSDIFDVAPDAVLTGQDVGKLRTVSVNPTIVYDGRDDAFKPTRGVFESLRLRYASPAFGSDAHFLKVVVQHSQYVPIGKLTWIYGARVGYALPIGISDVIPLRERFFLGGRTSVRGFDENEIGPRGDNGDPIGGDILFNVNSEIRFPLFLGLGGAVFLDGGALYLHDRAISIDEFRESMGPGLRYQTPIGSIALDYGFKLDRRSGESIGEVHFTIGNIF